MNSEQQYQPGQWRNCESAQSRNERGLSPHHSAGIDPDVRDRSQLLDLLGRINYQVVAGNRVYIQVGGVVYRTLYGGYWRSVFTGVEHYLLRCVEIPYQTWADGNANTALVDLPIVYSRDGWTTRGYLISLIVYRDQ